MREPGWHRTVVAYLAALSVALAAVWAVRLVVGWFESHYMMGGISSGPRYSQSELIRLGVVFLLLLFGGIFVAFLAAGVTLGALVKERAVAHALGFSGALVALGVATLSRGEGPPWSAADWYVPLALAVTGLAGGVGGGACGQWARRRTAAARRPRDA